MVRIDRRRLMLAGLGLAATRGAVAEDLPGLTRMAGALVMMGFRGADPAAPEARQIAAHLAAGRIGGVILFEDNVASPAAGRRLIAAFREAAGAAAPLIGIDQEGGVVSRLKPERGFQALPAARTVARLPPGEAARLYGATAAELRALGVTVNFGPVVDLDVNPANPIIGALGRSYGADPEIVIETAKTFVEAHRRNRVLTALKHFPGHGSTVQDSHRTLPDMTGTWRDEELTPFTKLIADGDADMVMVGHLMDANLTEPGRPASLSRRVVGDLLRGRLGYGGVVVSDDMQMGALRRFFSPDESIRLALDAGLDLLVFSNREHPDPEMPARFHEVVRGMVASGRLAPTRLGESRDRIAALKSQIG